jgi:histidyl-tRNA synthetase
MLTVIKTGSSSTGELLDKAIDIAEFYGFSPLDVLLKANKPTRPMKLSGSINLTTPAERKLASLTKSFLSHRLNESIYPMFAYHVEPASSRVGIRQSSIMGLHAIGSQSAIAEGIIIATLATLLRENGVEDFTVHINSLGDKESAARFLRELNAYMRSHINDMPGYVREELQGGNLIRAFSRLAEKGNDIANNAPNPMEYLNDESRTHLRNVLEYAESINVPYELNPWILGSGDCWKHTLFEIRIREDGHDVTIVRGGRYNTLAQKGFRAELPAVCAFLDHEVRGRIKPRRRRKRQIKFFFAQLGVEAKLQSFSVLGNLRALGIPVAQAVAIDSIGGQLEYGERHAVPYTVIIGHKEALENTAIVRNMKTRSQVVVPVEHLAGYLKRLKV